MAQYNALKYPITIIQGNDWLFNLTISLSVEGVKTPVDITTTTFTGIIKTTRSATTSTSMTVTITNAAAGQLTLSLTDAQTAALSLGGLYYQVDKTVGSVTQTILTGNFNVR